MKNYKNTLAILFFLYSAVNLAQVGVGTPTPAATLDITAANLTGSTVDGLLIPRVSRLRAQSMTGTPTSTILYIDNISNGTATLTTINVTTVGFYYFNGSVWERLGTGATTGWEVTGNTGLSGTTNFLGTTDNVDLAIRRNNVAAGKIGATSTSFGVNALTGGVATNNAAFGTNALRLSTGADNVAIGNGTLSSNTTGIQNTAVGNVALAVNSGSANTAIGFQSLNANITGNNGTAVGYQALFKNTASNNTGIGFQALANNTVGSQNTTVGFQAGAGFTNGSRNTSVGYQTLALNVTGSENTAMGNYALGRNTGSGNTAMGHEAMFGSGTNFSNSTAIGWHALFFNSASGNTAVGYNSLQQNGGTGGNTALGSNTLRINTASNNTAIGTSAGDEHGLGNNNTYVGFESGKNSSGLNATNYNAFFGAQAGYASSGSYNTAIGSNTLKANAATANNVAVGYNALTSNTGTGNVAIGYSAGSAETGSNTLYITNSATTPTTSLIYGEFTPTARILRTNSTFQIGNPAGTGYVFPAARGTVNQVLQTNAAGVLSWVNPSALAVPEVDPKVASTVTNSVPRWNGTALVDGVIKDDATNAGIGMTPLAGNKLDVNGKTRTTNFQMVNGASNGYIMQSDLNGNASWVLNPSTALSMVNATMTSNQTLVTGWQKINFNATSFDTGTEFNSVNNRFVATKAGYYRINASYHTNAQAVINQFSIGIYVNNSLLKLNSSDHDNHGIVERSVSGLVQLAVGDYVEIFAENFIPSGVDIDSYFGKSFFEIQQVR